MIVFLDSFIEYLLTTPYASYVVLFLAFMGFVSKLLSVVPPEYTTKVPDWLMLVINHLGGNHGHATNRQTDVKGNIRLE